MERTASPSRPSSSPRRSGGLLAGGLLLALAGPGAATQGPPPSGATIIITDPRQERLAIPDCVPRSSDEASREACRTLTAVLRRDLRFEGLFQFVSEPLMASIPAQDPDNPRLADWQGVNATAVVSLRAQVSGGQLTVTARVLRVPGGEAMVSKRWQDRADAARVIAHTLSDEIVALAQHRGVARTRIAFASDRDGARGRPVKEIYFVDYDGFNPRRATVLNSLTILPAWSPDGRSLAFTSYSQQRNPDIYRAFIYEARRASITGGVGQSFAPAFSPDGTRIAYASNRSGNMEVWVANADGSGAHKLTSGAALDTAPTWSPTGREIAFTSGRTGSPQIYVMDADTGLNVRRLTTVGNWNDAAAWNPSKEYAEIAYTSRLESGGFDIAVVDLLTRQVRQITQGRGSCEYPSWAPSGRHLVFACQRSRGSAWQITVSNRDGSKIETLPAGPGNNTQPDWSP